MDDESLNWFRFANCLVNVGNTVLQRLLNLFIKTCSFSDYHDLWLERVNQHCCSDNLKILWDSLHQQCLTLDAASRQIYQPLLSQWRRDIRVLPMKQQLSALERWEMDLQGAVSINTTQQDTLSKWSKEIQNLVTEHSSVLTYVRNWTKEFIHLCYVNQLDLLNLIERHNTSTCTITLLPTLKQDVGDPANALNSCHQKEQSYFHMKQIIIQTFFTSWQPKIDKLIDSWALNIPGCLNQKVLQSLLTDVKMDLPRVHNIFQVNLNDIGKEWHNRLKKMLTEWSLQLKNVGGLTSDLQDLTRKWCEELMHFPSISDLLIQNFFHSKKPDLQKLKDRRILTEPQWSLMFPSQGNINLKSFDTSLLCILLSNVCSVCPPEFGWKGKMLDTDHSMGADLMRMRNYRNDYFGHTAHAVLSASDFEKIWAVLEVILHRLSMPLGDEIWQEVQQKITELKACSFDPRLEIKLQLELINWYKSDLHDLDRTIQENCLGYIQTLIEKVQDLPQQHADLMSEIQDMKNMIQDMRQDVTRLLSERVAKAKEHISTENEAADSLQSESENELASEYESSDEDTSNVQQMAHTYHPLHLRDYQLELAKDAVHGENTIICAETGSGKTWVALYIAKNHLESASPRKKLVVFMAKTNPLIQQQYQRFMHHLPRHRTKLITAESEESLELNMFLPYHDIICLTPQILFNNLEKQTVSLSDFSLMILDECHHTKKDEDYNRLMRKYLMAKVKNNVPNLPQIVGLTASIGVGKSRTDDEAVEYIISVMANLDTCKLSTVEKYKEEIEKYVSRPKEVTIPMKDRLDDLCKKRILDAMNEVQEKLQEACSLEEYMIEIMSKRPEVLKFQQYAQWARNLETRAASHVLNPETARLIISCVKYLVTFIEALELNSLLGILDVCRFLARKFNPEKERQSKHTQEESELLQLILKVQKDLNGYDKSKSQMNPNLQIISNTLREMILAENDDQESRALVFVKARATCTALANYLDGVLSKDNIHVHKLTGKEGDDSMTSAEQTETVDKFVSGEYKVLVATSVAGEGIDIPDCNIVLTYNYAGNEITKIQMTGRGRKKGGKNIVMGYEKTLDIEKLNTYKAAMMYRAMESIKKMEFRTLQQKIRFLQKKETDKQESYDRNLKMQKSKKIKSQFKLCCFECATEVTDGENLRVLRDTFHIVIDKEFRHLIDVKPDKKPTPKKILGGLQKADRICCKKCGKDWGAYFVYEKLPLPTIKIKSFKIPNDGKFTFYDHWNKLPFEIETCELSELINLLEK